MNKIYNNLIIKNLIKTEWINQFDEEQQEQIRLKLLEEKRFCQFALFFVKKSIITFLKDPKQFQKDLSILTI